MFGVQNQCVPAAGEENFAVWVQNHEIRAVWGVRKWCWLPKSGVSQAYSNTWPRAGVSLGQHLAHLSVSLPVLTPVKRWKRNPEADTTKVVSAAAKEQLAGERSAQARATAATEAAAVRAHERHSEIVVVL